MPITDAALLAWLATDEGRELLGRAALLPHDRLTRVTRLRRLYSVEVSEAAVVLLELRARAHAKFTRAAEMLLTPVGLEQSTGERIAQYRALRFPPGVPVLDACSGIGGDAMHLAVNAPVLAVDRDPASCICTRHNCAIRPETQYPMRALCTDITKMNLIRLHEEGFRAAFFDPGRRNTARGAAAQRTRNPEEYLPPLSWLGKLREVFPFVCAKISPFIDDQVLQDHKCEIEFVSDKGECKEALLWAGDFARKEPNGGYNATVIDAAGASATLKPVPCPTPRAGPPANWIFEPDGAVVRAHLVSVLAAELPAWPLSSSSYYLTSDVDKTTPFATRYRILDITPLRPADIQKRCVTLGRSVTAVKTRWIATSPDEIVKKVPGAAKGAPPAVIIVTMVGDRRMALICEPG